MTKEITTLSAKLKSDIRKDTLLKIKEEKY
jgi:hypothetical protein